MAHVITTWPLLNGEPAGKAVVVEVPEDKQPGEIFGLIQKRMFPGVDFSGRDRAFEEIMAARASGEQAPGAEKAGERSTDVKAAKFPRSWKPADSAALALDTQNEEHASYTPPAKRPEASAARPKAPEHRKQTQEEPSDTPPAHRIPAAADQSRGSPPSISASDSSLPLAAGALSTEIDDASAAAERGGVRDTSMAAYRALQWSGKLAAQEQMVVDLFLAQPAERRTRQEIARDLKLGINAVCGRVNALLKEPFNILVENGKKQCSVTGNSVNALELARG